MKLDRKIVPNTDNVINFINKKRPFEDNINFQ